MLILRPIELRDANAFIAKHHRHHKPVVFHRFSISAWRDDQLVAVCVCGRPVARAIDDITTLEVSRLCCDGTAHACSMLYAAAARAAKAMGYCKIQTYVLETESGTSLKAAGWIDEGPAGGGQWKHTDEKWRLWPTRSTDQPTCMKRRWAKYLADAKALHDQEMMK